MNVRQVPIGTGTVRGTDLSRYDLYLALMPVPLLVGVLGAVATAVPVPYGAGVGSVASALLLGHGLFRDAPTPPVEGVDRDGAPADD